MKLIVKEPFGSYARGDEISGVAEVREALASNAGHVVQVASTADPENKEPDEPAHGVAD